MLRRESLTDLSGDDLTGVVAGQWSGDRDTCAYCLVSDRLPSLVVCPSLLCSERGAE